MVILTKAGASDPPAIIRAMSPPIRTFHPSPSGSTRIFETPSARRASVGVGDFLNDRVDDLAPPASIRGGLLDDHVAAHVRSDRLQPVEIVSCPFGGPS